MLRARLGATKAQVEHPSLRNKVRLNPEYFSDEVRIGMERVLSRTLSGDTRWTHEVEKEGRRDERDSVTRSGRRKLPGRADAAACRGWLRRGADAFRRPQTIRSRPMPS